MGEREGRSLTSKDCRIVSCGVSKITGDYTAVV